MPSDFFRTMEDASGIDLDWYWRGWFYSTDHVDIGVTNVRRVSFDTKNPYMEKPKQKTERDSEAPPVAKARNKDLPKRIQKFPDLADFYNEYDELDVTPEDKEAFDKYMEKLTDEQKETLSSLPNAYVVDFENIGGLVMPIILKLTFEDGKTEMRRIPAEIWRRNNEQVSKLIITEKPIRQIQIDPFRETADAGTDNNFYPRRIDDQSMELSTRSSRRRGNPDQKNPMQQARDRDEKQSSQSEDDK